MEIINISLAVVLSGFASYLFYHLQQTRQKLASYEKELEDLRLALCEGERPQSHTPEIMMTVKLLDPITVAKRASNLAKIASGTAPHVVIRKTYEQVVRETLEHMAERNIEVEIELVAN